MALKQWGLTTMALVLLVAGGATLGDLNQAQGGSGYLPTPDLFYNYYVPPCPNGGVGAELYVCPRPTPPYVGHTYITYPGLLPHEFLYQHHRRYWTQHPDGKWTRTVISWQ